jgi:FlaA1/EpsC-like NDP-sugar epimerase
MFRIPSPNFSPLRMVGILAIYGCLLTVAYWLAYELRFEFQVPGLPDDPVETNWQKVRVDTLPWLVVIKLALLLIIGEFRGILHFFRLPDLTRMFAALVIPAVGMALLWYLSKGINCTPRSVILADFQFSIVFLGSFRLFCRVYAERLQREGQANSTKAMRVGILGTGDVGAAVAADMLSKRGLGMKPVVFIDETHLKVGKQIHGIPMHGLPHNFQILKNRFDLDKLIIAPDNTTHFLAKDIAEWVRLANEARLKTEIVPSINDLASGRVRANRIRNVEMEDLLGREPVNLDSARIRGMLDGKVVLVTGAGGSIGSELARQILRQNPSSAILIDQVECSLFHLERELAGEGYGGIIVPIVADILDKGAMRKIFQKYKPGIVFHAAAHKHVPMMERQPEEALKNNFFGTLELAKLSGEMGTDRFILVSTDKAINPTSVMGVTKRLAESGIMALQNEGKYKTHYMAVRFGNVLGSSGSVIPIFREQIAKGGPLTVTHPETTRYFMTIPEASGLVLQCATFGKGGEIFVLDMGEPVKILDIARQMAELSGLRPDHDIEIRFTGLRPGEKLHEEIQHFSENLEKTEHPRIRLYTTQPKGMAEIDHWINDIQPQLHEIEKTKLKEEIRKVVPDYTPFTD